MEFSLAQFNNQEIFVTGGRLEEATKAIDLVLSYNKEERNWTNLPYMSQQRFNHGGCCHGNYLCVFAGRFTQRTPASSIEVLDLTQREFWQMIQLSHINLDLQVPLICPVSATQILICQKNPFEGAQEFESDGEVIFDLADCSARLQQKTLPFREAQSSTHLTQSCALYSGIDQAGKKQVYKFYSDSGTYQLIHKQK